jgi:hypothetical protein
VDGVHDAFVPRHCGIKPKRKLGVNFNHGSRHGGTDETQILTEANEGKEGTDF